MSKEKHKDSLFKLRPFLMFKYFEQNHIHSYSCANKFDYKSEKISLQNTSLKKPLSNGIHIEGILFSVTKISIAIFSPQLLQ